jgi:Radical SAM superfamily
MSTFRPERADSIGIIVQYECTYRCDHCLYACRPGLRETIRSEDLQRLVDAIHRACPGACLHIGGGEPFTRMDRLLTVVERIRRRGLLLEYVETNGFWVSRPDARDRLVRVREAGCPRLLLSISPFHNALLSCRDNRKAYGMIVDVFGPGGIFPWHPAYYPLLERVDPDRPVPFEAYTRHFSPEEVARQLTGIIYLHPAGRAALSFGPFLGRRHAGAYDRKQCRQELSSPVHAHVDPYGHYLTGFCSGLQVGDGEAFDLKRLYGEGIRLAAYPLLEMLLEGTVGDLRRFAERLGFCPDPEGYVSACHLCGHIRTWLYRGLPEAKRPLELAPGFFYEEMGRLFACPKGDLAPTCEP